MKLLAEQWDGDVIWWCDVAHTNDAAKVAFLSVRGMLSCRPEEPLGVWTAGFLCPEYWVGRSRVTTRCPRRRRGAPRKIVKHHKSRRFHQRDPIYSHRQGISIKNVARESPNWNCKWASLPCEWIEGTAEICGDNTTMGYRAPGRPGLPSPGWRPRRAARPAWRHSVARVSCVSHPKSTPREMPL